MNSPVSACWTRDQAKSVFVTEALEGGDAIFLATHTPIQGFDRGGRDAGEIDGDNEHAILRALADPNRRHAFCVVQGEPGSGKSHLVRWLSVNWSVDTDIKLLLRRADGSLEGALRQLKDRLPAEFGKLFDNIGQRQRANVGGRANVFAATLAATLEPNHFEKPVGDEKWCADFAPGDILANPVIRRTWKGPSRILNLLEGAGGERNSATASFDLYDIEDLANACDRLTAGVLSYRSQQLVSRLQREAETIQRYREQQWRADELAIEVAEFVPNSVALIKALNDRRNEAIRNVLGVSADSLKTLFRGVREALGGRGQRLVLLLEDITSWEGLDDSLLEVLVDNAEAHGGDSQRTPCPIISIVGVTPDFYDKLPGNIRQRITHEIKLGTANGGLQDVATLRDPKNRRVFMARYLASVRVSLAALEQWRDEFRRKPSLPPPNACTGCERKEQCFQVFGDEDGIGLFPFTAHALDRFFDGLKENDNGQTWRTPRGILQGILNVNLSQPEALSESRFPDPLMERSAIREDRRSDRVISNRLDRLIVNRIEDAGEQARMRRFLAYWGNPTRADTIEVDGELALAGAKRRLFEAFALPWIGDETADTGKTAYKPLDPPNEQPAPVVPDEQEDETIEPNIDSGPTRSPKLPARPRPSVTPPKPRRLTSTRTELERHQHELRNWSSGEGIENPSAWNKILFELLQHVDSRRLGIQPYLFERLVTQDMVKLQGSTAGSRQYLVVDAAPWVRDGLEGYLSLKLDRGLSAQEADFHRRNLSRMMRRFEKLIVSYIESRIPTFSPGERWSPVVGIAQVLVVRAWLRGTLAPEASTLEHLRAILSDEPDPTSDPKSRSAPWQDWLSTTDKWHDRLRSELRGLVTLSIGEGSSGLIDASEVIAAIERIRATGKVDAVPQEEGNMPDILEQAYELTSAWKDKWVNVYRIEASTLEGRAKSLLSRLRGNGIAQHMTRLDTVITAVADLLPGAASEAVGKWKETYSRLKNKLETDGRPLEEFIVSFEDAELGLPDGAAKRFGWMARAPAKVLSDFLELANIGEKLIEDLYEHVNDCIREASGTASLSDVKRAGLALKAATGDGDPRHV